MDNEEIAEIFDNAESDAHAMPVSITVDDKEIIMDEIRRGLYRFSLYKYNVNRFVETLTFTFRTRDELLRSLEKFDQTKPKEI